MAVKHLIGRGLGYGGIKHIVTGGLSVSSIGPVLLEVLPVLIDKTDNVELVRDNIGAILAANTIAQQSLATAAGKDPNLWKLRVFIERSNPWEQFRDGPADKSPIVNIWLSNGSYPQSLSNSVGKQGMEAIFNIDVYGFGETQGVTGGGQLPGDKAAAFESQRGARLVRNILMSAQNIYLQMQGVVGGRRIDTVDTFQPNVGNDTVEDVMATRLSFSVLLNEFSPQIDGVAMDRVLVDVVRVGDSFVLVNTNYDYTI